MQQILKKTAADITTPPNGYVTEWYRDTDNKKLVRLPDGTDHEVQGGAGTQTITAKAGVELRSGMSVRIEEDVTPGEYVAYPVEFTEQYKIATTIQPNFDNSETAAQIGAGVVFHDMAYDHVYYFVTINNANSKMYLVIMGYDKDNDEHTQISSHEYTLANPIDSLNYRQFSVVDTYDPTGGPTRIYITFIDPQDEFVMAVSAVINVSNGAITTHVPQPMMSCMPANGVKSVLHKVNGIAAVAVFANGSGYLTFIPFSGDGINMSAYSDLSPDNITVNNSDEYRISDVIFKDFGSYQKVYTCCCSGSILEMVSVTMNGVNLTGAFERLDLSPFGTNDMAVFAAAYDQNTDRIFLSFAEYSDIGSLSDTSVNKTGSVSISSVVSDPKLCESGYPNFSSKRVRIIELKQLTNGGILFRVDKSGQYNILSIDEEDVTKYYTLLAESPIVFIDTEESIKSMSFCAVELAEAEYMAVCSNTSTRTTEARYFWGMALPGINDIATVLADEYKRFVGIIGEPTSNITYPQDSEVTIFLSGQIVKFDTMAQPLPTGMTLVADKDGKLLPEVMFNFTYGKRFDYRPKFITIRSIDSAYIEDI